MQMLNFNEIMKKVILFVAIFVIACVSAHAQNYSNRNAAKAIVDAIEESNGTCYDRDSNGNIYKGTFYGHSADAISVFRFININIGRAVQSNGSEITIKTDHYDTAPLSAQDNLVEQYSGRGSNINIYYGTFIGGRYDSGGYYNPYLNNGKVDNIAVHGSKSTEGDNYTNVKTVFKYPK